MPAKSHAVPRPAAAQLRAAADAADRARNALRRDIRQLCLDAGISLATLARASGVPYAFLWRFMAGKADPSFDTLGKLAGPLGADLSARLYPNTGPTIRDRDQARILEALLAFLGGNWRAYSEVGVWKPVRGAIDAVLHDRRADVVVATEIESDLRRIEQTVRWSKEKAEALPSWTGWPGVLAVDGRVPQVSQLLIVRRTRANQRISKEVERQLALACPAHPEDALAALGGRKPWPGSALVWARIDSAGVRLLATR